MKYILSIFSIFILLTACETLEPVEPSTYTCQLAFPDDSEIHPDKAELEAALAKLDGLTPSVQVAIRSQEQLTWTGALGWADLPNKVPMTSCSKTMLGSISKVYTAVLIMQLQDDGLLSVTDPVSDWFEPEVLDQIENANEVSIQQLLDHTSGIRDYLSVRQFVNSINKPFLLETQEEKLAYVYGKSATQAPGLSYTYSNTNYVMLGLIVEKARNMPLWDAVDQYISQPLGLEQTEMGTESQPIPEGTARPYLRSSTTSYYDAMHIAVSDAATGDGGMASNMQETNLFIEGLFAGLLMSDAALTQMTQTLVETGPDEADFPQWEGESYGLGISLFKTPYGDAYGHTGSTTSYDAFLFYFPDSQVTISIAYTGEADSEQWGKRRELRERLFEILL